MSLTEADLDPRTGDEARRLAPRLIKGFQADYVRADWDGHDYSGCVPLGPNVLIRMDLCSSETGGGIQLTDDMIDRMTTASVTGCVVRMGTTAFRGDPEPPKVGERVTIVKYAGEVCIGDDSVFYRVVDEGAIICVRRPAMEA
jgi:co-chaperonin GroES (HSP10)